MHLDEDCPSFNQPSVNDPDAERRSPAERARIRAEGKAAPTIITASVERMDGSELSCFFHTVLAGLARAGIAEAPASVAALRRVVSKFLLSREAAATVITSTGETLEEAALFSSGLCRQRTRPHARDKKADSADSRRRRDSATCTVDWGV